MINSKAQVESKRGKEDEEVNYITILKVLEGQILITLVISREVG